MSDTLTPTTTPPLPSAPAPARTRTWVVPTIVIAACVAVVVVGAALATRTTPDPAPTANAGPLHAHFGQIVGRTAIVCDPAVALASVDGRHGVAVVVNLPGPAVVELDVVGGDRRGDRRDIHLWQQVTRRDHGARFDVPQLYPVYSVSVTAQVQDTSNIGTCEVLSPDLAGG
ncbi:MAG: hypothetical protein QOC75_4996 [Pseudonocardiales bacterium]|jgi:hypothetical protein|nr:hypothetical protein [Pseudonocardiales bacterium]